MDIKDFIKDNSVWGCDFEQCTIDGFETINANTTDKELETLEIDLVSMLPLEVVGDITSALEEIRAECIWNEEKNLSFRKSMYETLAEDLIRDNARRHSEIKRF
jgi:hypothetical protein